MYLVYQSRCDGLADQAFFKVFQSLRDRRAGADSNARLPDPTVWLQLHKKSDHCDRDDEIAPASEFFEGACGVRSRARKCDGRNDLVRLSQRLAIAGHEFFQRNRSLSAMRMQFDLGIEDQKRWDAVCRRRCVADIPRNRTGVLDMPPADLPRGALKREKGRGKVGLGDVCPTRGGADADAICSNLQAAKGGNPADVDNRFSRAMILQGWIYICATGEDLRPGCLQGSESVVQ